MWEVLLSLHRLADHDGALVFDEWRRRVRGCLPAAVQWLGGIASACGYSPVALAPAANATDLERALDLVLATPCRRPRVDLAEAIQGYHAVALAPFWPRIQATINADLSTRNGDIAHAGIEKLLSGLHPQVHWQPPLLEVSDPAELDLHLDGRGLLLVPSFFCWGRPVALKDPGLPPALVYPVDHELDWMHFRPRTPSARSLAALLGRTRAAVLSAIAGQSSTTTQLAQRTGVSMAAASQHATVLRNAGLITTQRHGSCVVHSITRLGAAMVTGPA